MAYQLSDTGSSVDGDELCWHYNTQKGCRRRRCPFVHKELGPPCRFFYHQKGCRFGPECNFSHKSYNCPGGCGVKHEKESQSSRSSSPVHAFSGVAIVSSSVSPSNEDEEEENKNNDKEDKAEKKKKNGGAEKEMEMCKVVRQSGDSVSCGTCGESLSHGKDSMSPKSALMQHYKANYCSDKHVEWFYENERQQYFGQGDLDWQAICMACYQGFHSVRGLFEHIEKTIKDKNSPARKDHDNFLENILTPLIECDLGVIEYEEELLHWLQLMMSSSYKVKGKHVYRALQHSSIRKKRSLQSTAAVARAMWELKEQERQEQEWEEEEAMANRYGFSEEQFNLLLSYGIKPWDFDEAWNFIEEYDKATLNTDYDSDTD